MPILTDKSVQAKTLEQNPTYGCTIVSMIGHRFPSIATAGSSFFGDYLKRGQLELQLNIDSVIADQLMIMIMKLFKFERLKHHHVGF